MSEAQVASVAKKERIGFWMDAEVAARFKAVARLRDGGVSQALTRMVGEALQGSQAVALKGVGQGAEVKIRLRGEERLLLARAARERGTTPANWIRSLALVHLLRRPEWNAEELEALRGIGRELRMIGSNINQIAAALNASALVGRCPPGQGEAAERAVELVRYESRRLAAAVTGNFDYYGLPWDERPTAQRGAVARRTKAEALEAKQRKSRPKLRPKKFQEGKGNGRD